MTASPPPMQDQLSIDHFDAIAERYAGSVRTLAPLYAAVREDLDAAVAGKAVLDVGSGGVFAYDRTLASSVAALDLSSEMLKRLPADVRRIHADARGMAGVADASFDVVLFSLSLHHVAADTLRATEEGMVAALASAWRVLRPGGELIVYEPVLGNGLFALETALFRPVRALLALAGVPMVYLRSRSSLERLIGHGCTVSAAPVSGWTDPLGGTFPGLLMIPAALHPTRFELFRAEKPVG
jgi:SAM-dependent methyltransferase